MSELAKRIRRLKRLTERQVWILEQLCQGLTYAQIARKAQLHWRERISEGDIEHQAGQIFHRLRIDVPVDGSLQQELKEFGAALEFLEHHRTPPPGVDRTQIREVVFAPHSNGPEPLPSSVTDLTHSYRREATFMQAVRRRKASPKVAVAPVATADGEQEWFSDLVWNESPSGRGPQLLRKHVTACVMVALFVAYLVLGVSGLFLVLLP